MNRTNILIIILIIALVSGIHVWYQNTEKVELEKNNRDSCTYTCVYNADTKTWSYTYAPSNPAYRVFPTQESCMNYCMAIESSLSH